MQGVSRTKGRGWVEGGEGGVGPVLKGGQLGREVGCHWQGQGGCGGAGGACQGDAVEEWVATSTWQELVKVCSTSARGMALGV